MPSAMGDRQMLPRHTNSTDIGSGIVVVVSLWFPFCEGIGEKGEKGI